MINFPIRIIGGRGYLGGQISAQLESTGAEFSVENFANITDGLSDAGFYSAFHNTNVIFLTSLNDLQITENDRASCMQLNIIRLFEFLNRIIRLKVYLNTFLFSSTASFYDLSYSDVIESTPIIPRSFYEWSKISCEGLCRTFWETNQVNFGRVIVLRLSNVYGASINKPIGENRGFLNFLMSQLAKGEIVNLYNNGEIFRDLIYIKDVAKCFVEIIKIKEKSFEIYNCGSGGLISLYAVAELVCEKLGLPFDRHVNLLQDRTSGSDVRAYSVNSGKLANHLSFGPQFNFEMGLVDFLRSDC